MDQINQTYNLCFQVIDLSRFKLCGEKEREEVGGEGSSGGSLSDEISLKVGELDLAW